MASIRNRLLLALISLLFLAHAYGNQSKIIATEASECGALYMILTSIPPDVVPGVGEVFKGLGQTMSLIHGVNLTRSTGSPASNADVSNAKSSKMDELGNTFDADPGSIYVLYHKCDQWRIKIAKLYQSQEPTSEVQMKDLINSVSIRPGSFTKDAEKENRAIALINIAFDYWTQSDRMTPLKFKKTLKNEISGD
ncbi:hypothetical protein N9A51_01285 [Pseudomonadales bacterium]|nr:hypothetical protein [Pseudomonadales bacterium]